jgi:hypothetical protein
MERAAGDLGAWTGEDDLSRLLGGKASADSDDWTPDMDAVRAVVHFTLATKRFERDPNVQGRTKRWTVNGDDPETRTLLTINSAPPHAPSCTP